MKVLLFTHKSDIDGMGNVVLAKLAFSSVDYVLCETYDLQEELGKFFDNGSIYEYDKIFVTDMWLEDPSLSMVASDENLKGKFFLFDHHESALDEGYGRETFTTIRISDEKGPCCGTSLFYEYLVNEGFIDNTRIFLDFVELTRKYDTWEWKRLNEEMPHELTLLFYSVGCEGYIELMFQKLKQEQAQHFSFNQVERMLIDNKKRQIAETVANYSTKLSYLNIMGYKAGIVFIDYEYRNDLAEYLREKQYDIDLVIMISMDKGTISYRSIGKDIVVRPIAEALGGKGHDKSAASPIDENQKQSIIKILTAVSVE